MILMPESCTIRVTFLLGCMRDKRDKATQLCELKNLAHHHEKIKRRIKALRMRVKKEQLLHLHKKKKIKLLRLSECRSTWPAEREVKLTSA